MMLVDSHKTNMGNPPKVDKPTSSSVNNQNVGSQLDTLKTLMYVVVIVLLVGFLGAIFGAGAIVQNHLAEKQATYLDLRDQVFKQNSMIEGLSKKLDLVCKTWRKDCPQ